MERKRKAQHQDGWAALVLAERSRSPSVEKVTQERCGLEGVRHSAK